MNLIPEILFLAIKKRKRRQLNKTKKCNVSGNFVCNFKSFKTFTHDNKQVLKEFVSKTKSIYNFFASVWMEIENY